MQQGLPISFNPRVVYRGLPMAMLNLGGTNAVQFGTTGLFQKMLAHGGALAPEQVQVGGAFLGGLASGVPCSVWELIMIQQQRFGGTMLGTPARLVREYGATALARGASMTMGREALFTMSMLGVTPLIQARFVARARARAFGYALVFRQRAPSAHSRIVVQARLVESSGVERNAALAAGSLAGALLAGVLTHPMDTIKTCMQGDLPRAKYAGVLATGRAIAAEHGVATGLFKGLAFRIALISTTFFLVNHFKGLAVPLLFPHAVEQQRVLASPPAAKSAAAREAPPQPATPPSR